MATIVPTWDRQVDAHGGVIIVTWPLMTYLTTDVGDPVELAEFSEKTFQAFGTYTGSAAVAIEGSNDGTNWAAMHDKQGNVISFATAGKIITAQDAPRWIRPNSTAGTDGMAVTIMVALHRRTLGIKG